MSSNATEMDGVPIQSPQRNIQRVGRLHVITDTTLQSRYTHAQLAELAIEGGADVIQYRNKASNHNDVLAEAKQVADVCRATNTAFIVNDYIDVCIASGAAGVHLGKTDTPIHMARQQLGSDAIIGGTVRDKQGLLQAEMDGADYVGLGPIFATTTKSVEVQPLGLECIRELSSFASIPLIAIAGISIENIQSVIQAGAFGVAVISTVCCADNVRVATEQLRLAIDAALS